MAHLYFIDPELKLVHVENTCPEYSVAHKYRYGYSVSVGSPEQAKREIDDKGYKACPRCLKREERSKNPKPGFVPKPKLAGVRAR